MWFFFNLDVYDFLGKVMCFCEMIKEFNYGLGFSSKGRDCFDIQKIAATLFMG